MCRRSEKETRSTGGLSAGSPKNNFKLNFKLKKSKAFWERREIYTAAGGGLAHSSLPRMSLQSGSPAFGSMELAASFEVTSALHTARLRPSGLSLDTSSQGPAVSSGPAALASMSTLRPAAASSGGIGASSNNSSSGGGGGSGRSSTATARRTATTTRSQQSAPKESSLQCVQIFFYKNRSLLNSSLTLIIYYNHQGTAHRTSAVV